ncbi:MAG: hypothetical protein HZB85_05640 [Deltaproteobacteria bacterium]|nr:hypothetical protein [Deltaproteobacteria bacterium]
MEKEHVFKKAVLQRCFTAREIQITLALLTVVALLAGICLQTVSSVLREHYGMGAVFVGGFLIIGYALIVLLIAIFFTHRLIGPFKRIEYEMKLISGGELSRRLSIRANDDLHVRNFVAYANRFIASFEQMSKDYGALNGVVSARLGEISTELLKENLDCERLKAELLALRQQVRDAGGRR